MGRVGNPMSSVCFPDLCSRHCWPDVGRAFLPADRLSSRSLDFGHFRRVGSRNSGGSGKSALLPGDCEAQGCEQSGIFSHFLPQQREQIEERRPVGIATPFGKGLIMLIAARTEG